MEEREEQVLKLMKWQRNNKIHQIKVTFKRQIQDQLKKKDKAKIDLFRNEKNEQICIVIKL